MGTGIDDCPLGTVVRQIAALLLHRKSKLQNLHARQTVVVAQLLHIPGDDA